MSDDLAKPNTDKAKVRLIHLSPDAGKLNLASGETELAENITYKNASSFKEIEAKETDFEIVDAEGEKTILTIKDMELVKGKIYTIWVSGLLESEDVKKKVKANVFANN